MRTFRIRRGRQTVASMAAVMIVAGCAPTGGSAGSTSVGAPGPAASTMGTATQQRGWRVGTEEHVDLWLHGFAMLTSDTGHVPFFLRDYKKDITALKRQRNVVTNLDANQPQLSQGFVRNPALTNAQFLAMYFTTFQELVNAVDLFVRANGDPRAASDPMMQQEIALLAANFPSPADRNWARLFVQSLQDESTRFYHAYWVNEQSVRGAAFAQFNQGWIGQYYPKLSRFLNNTQQAAGELVLSLPLGGEGRTVNGGKLTNVIAVEYPRTPEMAPNALFGFVHEAVASVVQEAINDNTTPAEQRSGATSGYVGNGAVRGGLLLLQRVAPDLAPAYMRYYLATVGRTATGDPKAMFDATFPLPAGIITAISSGIESALGGI
ncbi:MAG TPA: hypothetical protein VH277_00590 [Gemmatimonadaceae bacterium]|nr:hypothetical protein [Gemmatimonadaceae bacterium]